MSLFKYLAIAGVVVLAGLGYNYYRQNGLPKMNSGVVPSSPTASSTVPTATGTQRIIPPSLDATWQTYRNATLKFLLQFPTRGVYAPKFSVKVVNATDASIKDNCYDDIGGGVVQRVTLNGIDFCRVTHALNPPKVAIDTEYWATKKDSRIAVITFTKKYSTSTPAIAGCEEGGKLAGSATCKGFDVESYRGFVTSLMSTFNYPTTTTSP